MDSELKQYVDNTLRIQELSAPVLWDIGDASEYGSLLQDNYARIHQLAVENGELLSASLIPFLEDEREPDDETAAILEDFSDSLQDPGNLNPMDPHIQYRISDKLLKYVDESDPVKTRIQRLDREVSACYSMVYIALRLKHRPELAEKYRERGLKAGRKLLEFLKAPDFEKLPDDECRELVLINSRYLTNLHEGEAMSPTGRRRTLDMLERALNMEKDPYLRKHAPAYNWRLHTFRCYQYFALLLDHHNSCGYGRQQCGRICDILEDMERLWDSDPGFYGRYIQKSEIRFFILRARYYSGRISADDFREDLLVLYEERDSTGSDAACLTLNLQLPTEYLLTLNPASLSEEDRYQARSFYRNSLNYAYLSIGSCNIGDLLEFLSEQLFYFLEVPGGMSFEQMALGCISALHPPSYVHSVTVAQLTRCLLRHLMKLKPELFPSVKNAGDATSLLSFAYHAALCHDVGKFLTIDTITTYGRRLFDEEYELLREHADAGADLLSSHASTAAYANVARAHHLWYNGRGGYPEGLSVDALPERIVIDLVSCADCLDAATDGVGRYGDGRKTLQDLMLEIKEGAGTRYAPYLPELLARPEVYSDVEYILQQCRRDNYENTCRQIRDLIEQSSLYGENIA